MSAIAKPINPALKSIRGLSSNLQLSQTFDPASILSIRKKGIASMLDARDWEVREIHIERLFACYHQNTADILQRIEIIAVPETIFNILHSCMARFEVARDLSLIRFRGSKEFDFLRQVFLDRRIPKNEIECKEVYERINKSMKVFSSEYGKDKKEAAEVKKRKLDATLRSMYVSRKEEDDIPFWKRIDRQINN